ncbi:MAG: SIS domain-containing protein [Thermodesulfobacteriota bacterium]
MANERISPRMAGAAADDARLRKTSLSSFAHYADRLNASIRAMEATGRGRICLSPDEAFEELCRLTEAVLTTRGTIFFCGNGASATMASHAAADLEKNALVRTDVFTDPALLTAVANDICFSEVFAEPLRRKMRPGDMLVAVSSSGNSPNVLKACTEAKVQGGSVVTLSAMGPDNQLRSAGDLNFYVPATGYGLAESAHALILHYWIDRTVENVGSAT